MPFRSAQQEVYMKINVPNIWKKWVLKYGHHPDYVKRYLSKKSRTRSPSKRKSGRQRRR